VRVPYLLLKEVPRYECLQAAAARVPGANAAICEVFLNILHTGDVASRGEADFLARHGLNQARLVVLLLLDSSENGSMRSSELAEHASVSRATVTGLLDTLERAGLVGRAPDLRDRRASCVKITEKGKTLLHSVEPLLFQWTESVLGGLSAQEQGQLVTLLRKTQRAFSEHRTGFRQ
jgi:DNA-binding MarR family transcriptional regulator